MLQLEGKRVLITGACGTVGEELVRQLLTECEQPPDELVAIDNNESELFALDQKYTDNGRVRAFVADVRDRDEISRRMAGVDLVFHAAALKHVILSERSPDQVIQTNILGVQNVIAAAKEQQVEKVIFTSSDKAVNPTNVMGTSKLMGERLITVANLNTQGGRPIFASTRFGNVLGSRGSMIPIFNQQIRSGGPVTLTDSRMTRFVMSINESARLLLTSAGLAQGGEVFITKMPVVRIVDVIGAMIAVLAPRYGYEPSEIDVVEIGAKAGEKLYEELMNSEETRRSIELARYFAVLPAFRSMYGTIQYEYPEMVSDSVSSVYVSSQEPALSFSDIKALLNRYELLGPSL